MVRTSLLLLVLGACGTAEKADPETARLFRTLETGTAAEALEASDALAHASRYGKA